MFAVLYIVVAAVASFFPVTSTVDATSMNWSCLMVSLLYRSGLELRNADDGALQFGGVFIVACVDYVLRGRKHYIAPVLNVHKEQ